MHNERKTAIVTGASRGIGAAVAERLADDGFAVVVSYSGEADAANALVSEIASKGGAALAIRADVRDAAAMATLFDVAIERFGGIDAVVNNAGIMKLTPLVETDDASFDEQIEINLKGTFLGLRLAAKHVRDGGRIVNFSSSVVGFYAPTYAVYAATKAATEAMTHVLAKELGRRRVTVNAVAPGPVNTALYLNGKSPEEVQAVATRTPLGRLGEPEDVARVVSFLVGPDGAWINGQVVRANGGAL